MTQYAYVPLEGLNRAEGGARRTTAWTIDFGTGLVFAPFWVLQSVHARDKKELSERTRRGRLYRRSGATRVLSTREGIFYFGSCNTS